MARCNDLLLYYVSSQHRVEGIGRSQLEAQYWDGKKKEKKSAALRDTFSIN